MTWCWVSALEKWIEVELSSALSDLPRRPYQSIATAPSLLLLGFTDMSPSFWQKAGASLHLGWFYDASWKQLRCLSLCGYSFLKNENRHGNSCSHLLQSSGSDADICEESSALRIIHPLQWSGFFPLTFPFLKNKKVWERNLLGSRKTQRIGRQKWSLWSVAPELKSNCLLLALNTGILGGQCSLFSSPLVCHSKKNCFIAATAVIRINQSQFFCCLQHHTLLWALRNL